MVLSDYPCVAGIDIGSRSIELVVMQNNEIIDYQKLPTTFSPIEQCQKVIKNLKVQGVIATGYGRNLFVQDDAINSVLKEQGTETFSTITEIQAHSLGANYLFPKAQSVLDIGGQDTKVISLSSSGKVLGFEMNDRCAAGTGKFLEFMATALQISIEDFGDFALKADKNVDINTMCTVFAESEATSLMAKGESACNIAMGLHIAIVKRTLSMLRRKCCNSPIYFSGGVAHNPCVRKLLIDELGEENLLIAKDPDMTGALGAASKATSLL